MGKSDKHLYSINDNFSWITKLSVDYYAYQVEDALMFV